MKKSTLNCIIGILIIFVVILMLGLAMFLGVLSFNIGGQTTTTTTTPTGPVSTGDFLIDPMVEGNYDADTMDPRDADWGAWKLDVKITFSTYDFFAGTSVTTATVVLYDYDTESQLESVSISSGSGDSSAYQSGMKIKFKVSQSGYATYYGAFSVPYHQTDQDSAHTIKVWMVKLPTWEQACYFQNGTEIADAGTLNTTTDLSAGKAYLEFKNRDNTDDTGYVTSYNFLRNLWQNAYFYARFTGTGTDSVIIESVSVSYQKFVVSAVSDVWLYHQLDDEDLTRDKQSDLTYDPDGLWSMLMTLDLSGITSGDSVTCTYGVVIYGDATWLHQYNDWGPDDTSTTDTLTIAP
jgi:hypothetical protein